MPTGTLPKEGKKLWEEVYDKALKGSCKGDEACAAGSAWKAVKNAGWRKVGDKWVKKSSVLSEFSLRIERASYDKATNQRRWRAVASDTDEDSRGDSMSLELFNDFIARIKSGEKVPEEFQSEFWSGGMPYLSISHYSDLNGQGVPGEIDAVYIDGNRFKSRGIFNDTVLGRRCFEAVNEDLYGTRKGNFDKVRISIAFLDWMHKHKSNGFVFERKSIYDVCPECIRESVEETDPQGKIFLRGHLIHEALTRVPVNRRTSMEVDKSMAGITTRKQDAASIIGDDEAQMLDEAQAKIGKSQVLVEFSDADEDEVEELETETNETGLENPEVETEIKSEPANAERSEVESSYGEEEVAHRPYGGATSMKEALENEETRKEFWRLADLWHMFNGVMGNIFNSEDEDKTKAMKKCVDELQEMMEAKSLAILSNIEEFMLSQKNAVVESTPTPIDTPVADLVATFNEVSGQDISPDEKLVLMQKSYATLGEKIIEAIKAVPEPQQNEAPSPVVENSQLNQLADIVAALSNKVDLLVARLSDANKALPGPSVPERRSIQPQPFIPTQNMSNATNPGQPISIGAFARRSVGLE